jgi:hypothetical protein
MSIEQAVRREIISLIRAQTSRLSAAAFYATGALQNRAFDGGISSVATLSAPTAGIVTAAIMQSKASGFFLVSASGTVTAGAVEAAGVNVLLQTITPTVAGTLPTLANVSSTVNGIALSTGITAITVAATGGLGSEVIHVNENALNGLTSSALVSPWAFSAVIGASAAPELRLALGSYTVVNIALTVATTTVTISNFAFSVMELP